MFTADVLLNTPGITNSNNNDINAVRHLGVFPDGFYVNRRFTDVNAWFIKTDVPNGTKMFTRTPLQTKMEPDFDTGNLRFKARERYSFGVSDWRSWFGNQGA
jgi:membrane protease subunit (stomatin/prohibitin family)